MNIASCTFWLHSSMSGQDALAFAQELARLIEGASRAAITGCTLHWQSIRIPPPTPTGDRKTHTTACLFFSGDTSGTLFVLPIPAAIESIFLPDDFVDKEQGDIDAIIEAIITGGLVDPTAWEDLMTYLTGYRQERG